MTNTTQIRNSEIKKQHAALGNPAYCRITGTHAVHGYAKNFCRAKDTDAETFWTLADILDHAAALARYNAKGWNIFVTPVEEESKQIHILIDDLKPSFFEAGFQPNLLKKSSPKSLQAIFVLPYQHPREIYLRAFNQLNKMHGDPQISGLRHPFRLAGYTNQKPKYRQDNGFFPFVQLEKIQSPGHVCPVMLALISQLAANQTPTGPNLLKNPVAIQPEDASMGRDFYTAKSLIFRGKSGTDLRREFEKESEHLQDVIDGISGYDTDPDRYVSRTLENAKQSLEADQKKQSETIQIRIFPVSEIPLPSGNCRPRLGYRPAAAPAASSAPKP